MEIIKRLSLTEVYKVYPAAPRYYEPEAMLRDGHEPELNQEALDNAMFFIGFHNERFILCSVPREFVNDTPEVSDDDVLCYNHLDHQWEPLDF